MKKRYFSLRKIYKVF